MGLKVRITFFTLKLLKNTELGERIRCCIFRFPTFYNLRYKFNKMTISLKKITKKYQSRKKVAA